MITMSLNTINSKVEGLTFPESIIENNKVWRVEEHKYVTLYIRANNEINHYLERKMRIQSHLVKIKNINECLRRFILEKEVTQIFWCGSDNFGTDDLNEETNRLQEYLPNPFQEGNMDKALSWHQYLLEEEMYGIKSFVIIKKGKSGSWIQTQIYEKGIVTVNHMNNSVHGKFNELERLKEEVEMGLEIIEKIHEFNLVSKDEVHLNQAIKTSHPLSNLHLFVEKMIENSGELVKEQLNLNNEEYERFKNDLIKHSELFKDKMVEEK